MGRLLQPVTTREFRQLLRSDFVPDLSSGAADAVLPCVDTRECCLSSAVEVGVWLP
jgi:hypothetical protein